MKTIKRTISILLVLGLMTMLLTSCTQTKEEDPVLALAGFDKETVLLSFDGNSVTAEDYLYWLIMSISQVRQIQQKWGDEPADWDAEVYAGMTAREYAYKYATDSAKMPWVVEQIAQEYGITLTREEKAKIQESKDDFKEQFGGEDLYFMYIHSMGMTDAVVDRMNEMGMLAEKIELVLAEEDETLTLNDEALRTYMEDLGILKAKHILLKTKDTSIENGEYSDEKKQEQKELAEDLLAQLRESETPLELFDELMQTYSEDPGLAAYPGGYLFSTLPDGIDFTGRMVPEFETGTQTLAYNEIGEIVESTYGYHIILRIDPTQDEETKEKYEKKWRSEQVQKIYEERMNSIEIETTEILDTLDLVALDEAVRNKESELNKAIEEMQLAKLQEQQEKDSQNDASVEENVDSENDAEVDVEEDVTTESDANTENGEDTEKEINAE